MQPRDPDFFFFFVSRGGKKKKKKQRRQRRSALGLTAGWICLQAAKCGSCQRSVASPRSVHFHPQVRSLGRKHFINGRQGEWQASERRKRRRSSCTCTAVRAAHPLFPAVYQAGCVWQLMFSNIPNEPELAALALECFQRALITAKVQTPALDPAGSEAVRRIPGRLSTAPSPHRCCASSRRKGSRFGERVAPRLSSYTIL